MHREPGVVIDRARCDVLHEIFERHHPVHHDGQGLASGAAQAGYDGLLVPAAALARQRLAHAALDAVQIRVRLEQLRNGRPGKRTRALTAHAEGRPHLALHVMAKINGRGYRQLPVQAVGPGESLGGRHLVGEEEVFEAQLMSAMKDPAEMFDYPVRLFER